MYFTRSLFLAFVLSVLSLGSISAWAGNVRLAGALDGASDATLQGVTALESHDFSLLYDEAVETIHGGAREGSGRRRKLSDHDCQTVLISAFQRFNRNLLGQSPGVYHLFRARMMMQNLRSSAYFSQLRSIELKLREELEPEIDRREVRRDASPWYWRSRAPSYTKIPSAIFKATEDLPVLFTLIHDIEIQAASGVNPEGWKPVLDEAYLAARREVLWLDQQVKLIAPMFLEDAEAISAYIVTIGLANKLPTLGGESDPIFEKIFGDLPSVANLNVWANRYLTRTIGFFNNNIAKPVRQWAFRVGCFTILLEIAAIIQGLDTRTLDVLANQTFDAWWSLMVYSFADSLPLTLANGLDRVLNWVSSLASKNRMGPLSKALEPMRRGYFLERCSKALRTSK